MVRPTLLFLSTLMLALGLGSLSIVSAQEAVSCVNAKRGTTPVDVSKDKCVCECIENETNKDIKEHAEFYKKEKKIKRIEFSDRAKSRKGEFSNGCICIAKADYEANCVNTVGQDGKTTGTADQKFKLWRILREEIYHSTQMYKIVTKEKKSSAVAKESSAVAKYLDLDALEDKLIGERRQKVADGAPQSEIEALTARINCIGFRTPYARSLHDLEIYKNELDAQLFFLKEINDSQDADDGISDGVAKCLRGEAFAYFQSNLKKFCDQLKSLKDKFAAADGKAGRAAAVTAWKNATSDPVDIDAERDKLKDKAKELCECVEAMKDKLKNIMNGRTYTQNKGTESESDGESSDTLINIIWIVQAKNCPKCDKIFN